MGATEGRESMSSCVQRLVKLVPFIIHLNEFPFDNALLVIGEVMNNIASHEKVFCKKYLCLLREVFYVRQICAFHEKGFDMRPWCLLLERLQYWKFMSSMTRAFIREIEKSIKMCLWVANQLNFRVREYESEAQKSYGVLYVMV